MKRKYRSKTVAPRKLKNYRLLASVIENIERNRTRLGLSQVTFIEMLVLAKGDELTSEDLG